MTRVVRRAEPQGLPPGVRVVTYFVCDVPASDHFRVVSNLLARDTVSPIFTERERILLLTIAGAARPPRRHCWALRELSRRVALADMPADRRQFDA